MSGPVNAKPTEEAVQPADAPPGPPRIGSGSAVDEHDNYESRKRKRRRLLRTAPQWIQGSAAIALVFITGFYTHYAKKQQEAMLESNKISKQSLQSVQRAYISRGKVEPRPLVSVGPGASETQLWSVTVTLNNSGNTPAIDVVHMLSVLPLPKEPTQEQFMGKREDLKMISIGPREPHVIGAHSTVGNILVRRRIAKYSERPKSQY